MALNYQNFALDDDEMLRRRLEQSMTGAAEPQAVVNVVRSNSLSPMDAPFMPSTTADGQTAIKSLGNQMTTTALSPSTAPQTEPSTQPTQQPVTQQPPQTEPSTNTQYPPGIAQPQTPEFNRTPVNLPPPPPPPAPPPPTPDFAGAAQMDPLTGLPTFTAPQAPATAPDFQGVAGQAPEYQTPEGAFQGEDLYGQLAQYWQQWANNPNPYLSELAQATRAEMDARLAEEEAAANRGINEWAASRGLVGSSVEGDLRTRQNEAMQRVRLAEEVALLQRIADAENAGRIAAGQFGLGAGQLGAQLGQQRIDEARQAAQLGLQRAGLQLDAAQLAEQAEQFRSQFALEVERSGFDAAFRNAQLQQSDAFQRAQLNLEAARAGDQAALQRVQLELDQMRAMDEALLDRTQLQLQEQEIDLRAFQIQAEMAMQGQRLSMEEARWQAEMQFRREQEARRQEEFERTFAEGQRQHDDLMDWRMGEAGTAATTDPFAAAPPGLLVPTNETESEAERVYRALRGLH